MVKQRYNTVKLNTDIDVEFLYWMGHLVSILNLTDLQKSNATFCGRLLHQSTTCHSSVQNNHEPIITCSHPGGDLIYVLHLVATYFCTILLDWRNHWSCKTVTVTYRLRHGGLVYISCLPFCDRVKVFHFRCVFMCKKKCISRQWQSRFS